MSATESPSLAAGKAAGGGPKRGPVPRSAAGRRPRFSKAHVKEWAWGYAMIAPLFLGLVIFYLWPIIQSAYFSFTSWGVFGGRQWVGFQNYSSFMSDPQLPRAAWNTVKYSLIILAGIPLSIVFAALMNQVSGKYASLYRVLYFIPVVTMPAAVAMIWRWLYNGDYGLINYLLSLVGIHGPHWVSDDRYTVWAMGLVGIWSSLGYNMIIFAAGLKNIPRQYYEASSLDGAGRIRQFFSITLPLLSPSIFFVSVLSVIAGLQMFDMVLLMLGKTNPALAGSKTIAYLFYEDAFVTGNQGLAAAIAVVLTLVLLVLTALQFRLQKRWVHYG